MTDLDIPTKDDAVNKVNGASEQAAGVAQTLKSEAGKLTQQAGDKARSYAEDGKARAGGALDELSRMLTEAAGNVDDKLGAQYGGYARSAAEAVSGFSESLKDKDIDDLVDEAREFVRKSPAVAIGAAATIGFIVARLVKAGLDGPTTTDKS